MPELINTLATPGEFDALGNLRPDEPYFILIGRDRLAPPLVQQWADANRKRALEEFASGKIDKDKRARELEKSTEAEQIGWAMAAFKEGSPDKPKDTAEPRRESYTGVVLPEATKLTDAKQRAQSRAYSALDNAIAELAEFADAVEATGDGFTATGLRAENAKLADLATYVKPKRPVPQP